MKLKKIEIQGFQYYCLFIQRQICKDVSKSKCKISQYFLFNRFEDHLILVSAWTVIRAKYSVWLCACVCMCRIRCQAHWLKDLRTLIQQSMQILRKSHFVVKAKTNINKNIRAQLIHSHLFFHDHVKWVLHSEGARSKAIQRRRCDGTHDDVALFLSFDIIPVRTPFWMVCILILRAFPISFYWLEHFYHVRYASMAYTLRVWRRHTRSTSSTIDTLTHTHTHARTFTIYPTITIPNMGSTK